MERRRVLFICVGNSARSIMGEAILRQLASDRYEVHSAGLSPTAVRPETLTVLQEAGFDTQGLQSKCVDEYLGRVFCHFVITVCEEAAEGCPRVWPPGGVPLSWPVPDPALESGDEEQRMQAFRRARDDLRARIEGWLEVQANDS